MDPTLLPGAREGLDARKYKVYAMAELYNPDIFSSAVLAANKEEWVADVKSAYMDFMDFATRVKARPESTPTDKEEVQNILGAVRDDYAKFLEDFSAKCLLTPDTTTSSDDSSVNGTQLVFCGVLCGAAAVHTDRPPECCSLVKKTSTESCFRNIDRNAMLLEGKK